MKLQRIPHPYGFTTSAVACGPGSNLAKWLVYSARRSYVIFFVVQMALFLLIPYLAAIGNWLLFEAPLFVVFTMYGGGFSTIPAFLADIFGADNVGAIHGSLLTAWSAATVAGPVIITELSNRARAALASGMSKIHIYDTPLRLLAVILPAGSPSDHANPAIASAYLSRSALVVRHRLPSPPYSLAYNRVCSPRFRAISEANGHDRTQ